MSQYLDRLSKEQELSQIVHDNVLNLLQENEDCIPMHSTNELIPVYVVEQMLLSSYTCPHVGWFLRPSNSFDLVQKSLLKWGVKEFVDKAHVLYGVDSDELIISLNRIVSNNCTDKDRWWKQLPPEFFVKAIGTSKNAGLVQQIMYLDSLVSATHLLYPAGRAAASNIHVDPSFLIEWLSSPQVGLNMDWICEIICAAEPQRLAQILEQMLDKFDVNELLDVAVIKFALENSAPFLSQHVKNKIKTVLNVKAFNENTWIDKAVAKKFCEVGLLDVDALPVSLFLAVDTTAVWEMFATENYDVAKAKLGLLDVNANCTFQNLLTAIDSSLSTS